MKPENDAWRKALSEAARESGALLICLKKASKFEKWLAEEQRPPYVLLTDWRELKPCIKAAGQQQPENRPMYTVALCERPFHFYGATQWVMSLPPNDAPIDVRYDVGPPKAFVYQLTNWLTCKVETMQTT